MVRIVVFSFLLMGFPAGLLFSQTTDSLAIDPFKHDNISSLNHPASSQRQMITASQIRLSGYSRVSDLFQLIDGWTFASVNGDKWYLQSNGTSHYQNQNWVLLLNGQKINLNRLDAVHINLLGIQVNDIERIEIVNTPTIYLNEYADKGIIHIVTKTYAQGITVKAMYNNGNETGDPGPYRYTGANTTNINRIGQNYAVSLGYVKGNFSIQSTFNSQEYYARSESVRLRYTRFNNPAVSPNNEIKSSFTRLAFQSGRWSHQLQGTISQTNDFTFIYPYSTEIRNYQQHFSAGYHTLFKLTPSNQFRFNFAFDNTDFSRSSASFFVPPVKNQQAATGNISYTHYFLKQKKNAIVQSGVAFDHNTYQFYSSTNKSSFLLIKPYAVLSLPASRKSTFFTDVMFTTNQSDIGFKTTAGIYKRADIITNWNFLVSYSNRLAEEDNNMVYVMADRSEKLQLPNAISLSRLSNNSQFTSDFYYGLTIGNNFKFIYNLGFRTLWNQSAFLLDTSSLYYHISNYGYQTGMKRTDLINRFYLYYNVLNNMIFHIHYMRTGNISGNESLSSSIPKNKITFTAEYQLPKKIQVWGRVYWQSATNWKASNAVDSFSVKAEDSALPELFLIDAGIGKQLFKDHLYLNFTIRNVLNKREIYHPLGADMGLRMFVTVSLHLEGLRFKRK